MGKSKKKKLPAPPATPPAAYQWELIENFRKRSDDSANILRALLLTIATAGAGFIMHENYSHLPNWHLVPVSVFGLATMVLIYSWSKQKQKSINRLIWIRDHGYEHYLNLEKCKANDTLWRNETIDWVAVLLIGIGYIFEIAIPIFEYCRR